MLVGEIRHHAQLVDVRGQRAAKHLGVGLIELFAQPFRAGVGVRQGEHLVLAKLLAGRPAARVGLHRAAVEQQQGIDELRLVVDPVGLEAVVGVDEGQHALEVAALVLAVPVFDHRNAAEKVPLAAFDWADVARARRAKVDDLPFGADLDAPAVLRAVVAQPRAQADAEERAVFDGVVVDDERQPRVQRGGARPGLGVGEHQLDAPPVEAGLPRELDVDAVDRAEAVVFQHAVERGLLRLRRGILDRVAGQIPRGQRADVARKVVREPGIGQPRLAQAVADGVRAVVIPLQPLQPRLRQ